MPVEEPGGVPHGRPAQQSASVLHAPPDFTQLSPQMYGEPLPLVLGTQGMPQQSALVAHAWPVMAPASPVQPPAASVQRGMPSRSRWQVSLCCTLPAQHTSVAEHDWDCSRQIDPAGEHFWPWLHSPSFAPAAFEHLVFASLSGLPGPPQQSLSVAHTSPVGRQPLGGWQTWTPVGPYGAHEWLQQNVSPHAVVPPAAHTVPAMWQPPAPGPVGTLQVPSVAPLAFVQMPPQHSPSCEHASPVCVQNDGLPEHMPFTQYCEQQSPLPAQLLPEVLQAVFSGLQVLPPSAPAAQLPLQHWASLVHAWLSLVHTVPPHVPPLHTMVQQSVGDVHAAPCCAQVPIGFTQVCSVWSQLAEQQSLFDAHVVPTIWQLALPSAPLSAAPPLPSVETSADASLFPLESSELLPQP